MLAQWLMIFPLFSLIFLDSFDFFQYPLILVNFLKGPKEYTVTFYSNSFADLFRPLAPTLLHHLMSRWMLITILR